MPRPSPPPPKRSTCPNGLLTPPPYPLCRTPCPCLMTQGNAGDVSPTAGLQAGPGCWGRRPSQARSRAVARRSPLQWNKTFERVMRLWLLKTSRGHSPVGRSGVEKRLTASGLSLSGGSPVRRSCGLCRHNSSGTGKGSATPNSWERSPTLPWLCYTRSLRYERDDCSDHALREAATPAVATK